MASVRDSVPGIHLLSLVSSCRRRGQDIDRALGSCDLRAMNPRTTKNGIGTVEPRFRLGARMRYPSYQISCKRSFATRAELWNTVSRLN